jgi:phage gpG-like protein
MIKLKLQKKNFEIVAKKLKDASERAENAKNFWDVVAGRAYKQVIKNFQDERGPDGRWAPLKVERARDLKAGRKRVAKGLKKRGHKILQDTGRLRGSILFRYGKNFAELWTNVAYAEDHQYGVPARNLPQREFLWVPEDFLKNIADSLTKYVTKGDKDGV